MGLDIKINVEGDGTLSDEAVSALAMVAHVTAIVETLKARGLTMDEAAERTADAVRTAWNMGEPGT